MMRLLWDEGAWEDYLWWQENDRKVAKKINELIRNAQRTPFEGLGKPEPLKENWSGWWSRRITQEHRLVYRVTGEGEQEALVIAQCRYHY